MIPNIFRRWLKVAAVIMHKPSAGDVFECFTMGDVPLYDASGNLAGSFISCGENRLPLRPIPIMSGWSMLLLLLLMVFAASRHMYVRRADAFTRRKINPQLH